MPRIFQLYIIAMALTCISFAALDHALAAPAAPAQSLERQLTPLLGARDAVLVAAPGGRILAAIHADTPLVPASILKVLTALAAIHHLGADYRFPTEFYTNSQNDLIVKGYGDPLLLSENLEVIARQLPGSLKTVGALVLDDSYFAYPIEIPGRGRSTNPYDAPNGALCVNFNTVSFQQQNGRFVSAEPQTPLLPAILPKIKASGLKSGRITLAADREESLRYAGEMFTYFFRQAGITVPGPITFAAVDPQKDKLLHRYRSERQLTDAVANLLSFSNNFIANQLLLAMGAQVHGAPATMDKGLEVLRGYYGNELGLKTGYVDEGSGLSRRNQVTARAMLRILAQFAPHFRLMRNAGRQWYKTGTLKDVSTRVGYIEAADGGKYSFVVMRNTPGKSAESIVRILERELK
ncbi:MAG: D-alanyl-D-alanine carboxypeptidase [Desulfobacterales bacterium]|nr:D-alanyl-D-alanine carboxypeptidase [Desulfobacterales bacterium]